MIDRIDRIVQKFEITAAWVLVVLGGWRYVTADVPRWASGVIGVGVGLSVIYRHRREDRRHERRDEEQEAEALREQLEQSAARGRARVDWFHDGGAS